MLTVELVMPVANSAVETASKTPHNLQSAHNGESNAHAKYIEFISNSPNRPIAKAMAR